MMKTHPEKEGNGLPEAIHPKRAKMDETWPEILRGWPAAVWSILLQIVFSSVASLGSKAFCCTIKFLIEFSGAHPLLLERPEVQRPTDDFLLEHHVDCRRHPPPLRRHSCGWVHGYIFFPKIFFRMSTFRTDKVQIPNKSCTFRIMRFSSFFC